MSGLIFLCIYQGFVHENFIIFNIPDALVIFNSFYYLFCNHF